MNTKKREISFNSKYAFVHCIRCRFLINTDSPFQVALKLNEIKKQQLKAKTHDNGRSIVPLLLWSPSHRCYCCSCHCCRHRLFSHNSPRTQTRSEKKNRRCESCDVNRISRCHNLIRSRHRRRRRRRCRCCCCTENAHHFVDIFCCQISVFVCVSHVPGRSNKINEILKRAREAIPSHLQ